MKTFTVLKLSLMGLLTSQTLMAQNLVPWTEENSTLGLGYPVPIPVDTSEPFDGFRTYDGLFAKYQSMALNNDYITGHVVGQTLYDRDIWAYVLSDNDNTTRFGVKEGAMLINGGIHAREWQSPETLAQIITDFNDHSDDQSFYQFLLENTTIVTVPVNNVDGFLQTQRYPTENWLGADPVSQFWPRDGRMRRKNLRDTDEILTTTNDHLNGVDLNRNNSPYWATFVDPPPPSGAFSSANPNSLVYHGTAVHSEPETLARIAASELVDSDQFRVYTDVHSYSQVHFSTSTFNANKNILQSRMLADFSQHHVAFPQAKFYQELPNQPGLGIGATDGYFGTLFEIPSWTLEIEPTGNAGADYGGFAINGHDGFILPESEIKRVREQLAESFMVTWYGQAGPPSITQMRIIDQATQTIVFDAEWDINGQGERDLYSHYFDEILAGRDYALMLRFDKPMRYRDAAGVVTSLQGQSTNLNPSIQAEVNGVAVALDLNNPRWVAEKSANWESFGHYKDDTFITEFTLDSGLVAADNVDLNWIISTTDMVGQSLDSNPATAITWSDGSWINYENSSGSQSISGGEDSSFTVQVSNQAIGPEPIVPLTAHYFSPSRSGEGFNIEVLSDESFLLQWYTYDTNGNPRWFLAAPTFDTTNAFFAPDVFNATGGVFGPDFDPLAIDLISNGSVEMIFETIDLNVAGNDIISHVGQMKYTYPDGRKYRSQISPVALAEGIDSISDFLPPPTPPQLTAASLIGSWFDTTRNGEGFHIQQTTNGNMLIQWYSFDLDGNQLWFISSDGQVTETENNINVQFDTVFTARGPQFGADFDSSDVELTDWGSIELNLSCTSGTLAFNSNNGDFGSAEYTVVPITRPAANINQCAD